MRKLILMTSAAVIAPISAIAQTPTCTATPDCASLGYTEASCPNGGVKCPWGNTWFCSSSETEICSKYGFKYTCTGNGYSGGTGGACMGKYASCTCADGYEWKNGSCSELQWGKCTGLAANCSLGDILFSDGTCSANKVSGKTPIAVVVYKSGKCGQAMALNPVYGGTAYQWSTEYVNISSLTDYTSETEASQDFASCENSAKIRAQGDSSTYPAVWAAYNYTTTGTKVGVWCLPAAGILTSIKNNQSTINTGFSRAGGIQFTSISPETYAWSSSEDSSYTAWYSHFGDSYGLGTSYKRGEQVVRPVIEF